MPGFFEFMKRMATGKPVFNANDGEPKPAVPTSSPSSTISKNNASSFPVVYVKRVTAHMHGAGMQVYGEVENTWPQDVMLDKFTFLGTTRELDAVLRGHEEREFLLYDGPRPPRPDANAALDYKTQQEGDYFEALHDVTFTAQPDHTFIVDEIRLRPPIRDIYG